MPTVAARHFVPPSSNGSTGEISPVEPPQASHYCNNGNNQGYYNYPAYWDGGPYEERSTASGSENVMLDRNGTLSTAAGAAYHNQPAYYQAADKTLDDVGFDKPNTRD